MVRLRLTSPLLHQTKKYGKQNKNKSRIKKGKNIFKASLAMTQNQSYDKS